MPLLLTALLTFALFITTVTGCGTVPQENGPEASNPRTASEPTPSEGPSPRTPKDQAQPDALLASAARRDLGLTATREIQESSPSDSPAREENPSGPSLQRLAVTRAVIDREPIDPDAPLLAEPSPLYAFLDVQNPSLEAKTFTVIFRHSSGKTAGHVDLTVPPKSPRWRTWARSHNVTEPGPWTLEVTDEAGDILRSLDFELQAP
ncbi:MAG: DUF2914 domain-containing protein [Myxococcales bacterium]|nr:DUF2914 domain-containing protein [Myxococcales bacterium]